MPADPTVPMIPMEKLDYLASNYATDEMGKCEADTFEQLDSKTQRELITIALLAEQVAEQKQTNFFLSEAYDIYNARFR